jgi:hypothetical protein
MLCIQHLSEHDKYIEKQIQDQKQLENLWKNYNSIINEDKIHQELNRLNNQLDNYRKLKEEINHLLLINHFHDSIENYQKFQTAIQTIQKEINSKRTMIGYSEDVQPKIEVDEPTNDCKKSRDLRINSVLFFLLAYLSSSMTTNDGKEKFENGC